MCNSVPCGRAFSFTQNYAEERRTRAGLGVILPALKDGASFFLKGVAHKTSSEKQTRCTARGIPRDALLHVLCTWRCTARGIPRDALLHVQSTWRCTTAPSSYSASIIASAYNKSIRVTDKMTLHDMIQRIKSHFDNEEMLYSLYSSLSQYDFDYVYSACITNDATTDNPIQKTLSEYRKRDNAIEMIQTCLSQQNKK
jgi:hypothetical protein